MRRLKYGIALLFALFLIVGFSLTALADSPNFHFANSSISSSTGALTVSFKETGLGTTVSTEHVTLTVDTATALYQCFNNGGNHPKATTGDISAGPPSQNANGPFACPSGQSLFLQSVTYSGIKVTGSAGDFLGATPDPISSGPIHILIG